MKRDWDNLDLRTAFPEMPESCRDALLTAARSVKEEKEMKRATFRVALIAALIILSLTAVAFAAGSLMGWSDFYGDYGYTSVPQGAYEQMQVKDDLSWQVGPLTFTATELLTDGHISVSAIHVRTTDGSPALITGLNTCDATDPIRANGENGRAYEQRLGLAERTTWLEAAQQLNLPLYRVCADQDMSHEAMDGEMMIDVLYNEDGSITYFCMSLLNAEAVGDTLTLPLELDVFLTDSATGENIQRWQDFEQTITMTVCPVLETRTYYPETETVIAGHKLLKAEAVRYVTGAYLTLTYEMNWADVPESAYALYDLFEQDVLDGSGNVLPRGMSLTGSLEFTITQEMMLGVDALPDVLTLQEGAVLIAK